MYSAYLLPSVLEPTLNELVGLRTREDYWPATPTSESIATSPCPRRIRMRGIEQPDGKLRGGPHFSISIFDEPKFHNADTNLWRYWPASVTRSTPGLVFPKEDDVPVDPWDVSGHQDPPFYRRFCEEPPYESGTTPAVATHQSSKRSRTPAPRNQSGNLKINTGSHNTPPLHSHL